MTADRAKDLLVEIGCEELPPAAVADARGRLPELTKERLAEARLPAASASAFATPRRLLVVARGVSLRQEREVKRVTGPPKAAAYDADGKLTPAGRGFLKKWNVSEKELLLEETAKGEYLAAEVASPERDAPDVLAELVPEIISALPFPKTMRWPQADVAFPRPIRWLACLYGGAAVPAAYAGLKAGSRSYGHRTIAPGPKDLAAVFDKAGSVELDKLKKFYEKELGVVVDAEDRRQRVLTQLKKIGVAPDYFEKADYHVRWTFARVLDEVEAPSLVAGEFDEKYLALPAEVVEAALLGYLHLFPIVDKKGRLEARFFAVDNARPEAEGNVRAGLERVLAARLADAAYFWETDRQTPLADMAAALDGVVFAEGAGTVADKAARLEKLTAALAERLGLLADERADLARAAALCKADLTSEMVREKEFAHLQGTMGKLYAEAAGEPAPVAEAIGEHYRPVAADDPLPATKLGRVLSLADRLDTLVSLFATGNRPTGAKDPFALRRAAIGLCRLLLEDEEGLFEGLAVEQAVAEAAAVAGAPAGTEADVDDFVRTRLEQIFLERGLRDDMVGAVVFPAPEVDLPLTSPRDQLKRLDALQRLYADRPAYLRLAIAFKRPINILRQGRERELSWSEFDAAAMEEEEERELFETYRKAAPKVGAALDEGDPAAALRLLAEMRPAVDRFFDEVMVMCEDERLRSNRLALMQLLADLFLSFADFTRLRGEEDYE
jgi:glycyl-tRNA synthetase beta chain